MDLSYKVPQGDTIKQFVKVFWDAFEPPEADMIMPMIFYGGLTEDVSACLEGMIRDWIAKDPRIFFVLAKDHQTGELAGISCWTVVESAAQTMEEIDAAYENATQTSGRAPVKVLNEALGKAQHRAGIYAEKTTMLVNRGNPYGVLKILAVAPKYHRRGIGSKLLTEGLQEMDKQQLPVYLDCGVQGKPLYERFGFEFVQDYPLDARQYGGRSEGKHWCMLRPKKVNSKG